MLWLGISKVRSVLKMKVHIFKKNFFISGYKWKCGENSGFKLLFFLFFFKIKTLLLNRLWWLINFVQIIIIIIIFFVILQDLYMIFMAYERGAYGLKIITN